jgi:DNA-binding SARP family transcriptional activator
VQDPRTAAASAEARPASSAEGRAARVSLKLLDGFELRSAGEPIALPLTVQRLLAFLALESGSVRRAHVVAELWFARRETRAHGSLRSTLWRLNRDCSVPVVESTRTHLGLVGGVTVDVRDQAALARRLLDPSSDVRPAALAILEGELLPDWHDEWLLPERRRLRQLRLHALEAVAMRLVSRRRYGEAVEAAFAALAADPLRESAHRVLIRSYLAEGNLAEAISQYQRCRELLGSKLGVGPSPELRRLGEELTRCGCARW